jgi:peptidoglycan-associated lipoprotein
VVVVKTDEAQKARQQYVEAIEKISQPVEDYELNQTSLSAAAKADLDRKVQLLQTYPQLRISLEGHTCNTGTHEVNVVIGQKRANVAKEYLVKRGISPNRIRTVSKAETSPIAPNDTETNRQKNRRVEVIIENAE